MGIEVRDESGTLDTEQPTLTYYVETVQAGDEWGQFSEPIVGEKAAQEHLERVREFAVKVGYDPARVRLHSMTEREVKEHLVKKYNTTFYDYVLSLPLPQIRAIVAEARARRFEKLKEDLAKPVPASGVEQTP